MVNPAKITMIVNFEAPKNVKQLHVTFMNTKYYRIFIKAYAQITMMEKLLKKDAMFCCDEEFQHILDVLKENMVSAPILLFPDLKKEFHVHVDASFIALSEVLTKAGEREIDHPIVFATKMLSKAEKNYSSIE